jgi:hypothetical protein
VLNPIINNSIFSFGVTKNAPELQQRMKQGDVLGIPVDSGEYTEIKSF